MYVSASGVRTLYAPPEGYVPDYDNPQRQYVATTYGVWSVGILLALLFVAQRLYVNIAIRKKFGLGDGKPYINLEASKLTPSCSFHHSRTGMLFSGCDTFSNPNTENSFSTGI